MKILIISRYCTLPSYHGSAQHVQSFSKELNNQGHKVEVITGEDAKEEELKIFGQIQYHIIPLPKTSNSLDSLLSSTIKGKEQYEIAQRIYNAFRPDIIHFGVAGKMTGFLGVAISRKIPITAMMHDFFWVCLTRFKIRNGNSLCNPYYENIKCYSCIKKQVGQRTNILNKINLYSYFFFKKFRIKARVYNSLIELANYRNSIDAFIAQTQDHMEELLASGVSKSKIHLVTQGLRQEKLFVKDPDRLVHLPIRIGYFGRVSKEKNIQVLIKAFNLLSGYNKLFQVVFIANGMNREKIESISLIKLNENINLRIIDNVKKDNEVTNALSTIDVCVITSSTKESPRCLLEAIAQKVPCIVENTLGNQYLVRDQINGRIFSHNNEVELKNILKHIINNPHLIQEWRRQLPRITSENERTRKLIGIHEKIISDN